MIQGFMHKLSQIRGQKENHADFGREIPKKASLSSGQASHISDLRHNYRHQPAHDE